MKCPRCESKALAGQKFCGECGAHLNGACPVCGHPQLPGQKFCGECGAAFAAAPASKPAAAEVSTHKYLTEQLLSSASALEGERKHVTVLFADMKGSLEAIAGSDPEEVRTLLDPVIEHMKQAVHRYEGTVNRVAGDGIMALFGAPLAQEDHAVRACYAALSMQAAIQRYSEAMRRSHGVEVQIRVGLNSGETLVRAIEHDVSREYSAEGVATHLAARMEQLAAPGSIRLTAETLRLAEGYVAVKALGPVPVKGLSEPIEVYELTGAGAARTRIQASAARGLSRFVGRDPEMQALRLAIERAAQGHGQAVSIVGEPGVGKSRLYYEFTHSHYTRGWLVLAGGSVSYGKATSYLPIIDLLKGYFCIQERDDARERRDKVIGRLLGLDRSLEPLLTPLLALLDLPAEDAQWQQLDPPQRRRQTLDAVKRLLLRESQIQPLMVVFEDLHWIDTETQGLLDSLIDSLPTLPVLLLLNYRPEYSHHWGAKTYYTQLRIDPLPPESAEALIEPMLGGDPSLQSLKRLLIERTEGNPLFLEESVRTLVETGAIQGERGVYRLTAPLSSIQVPATVQAILAARIDRLPAEEKQLLQSASVIGKDVPYTLLRGISGISEDELHLHRGLAHLQAAEFLYETSLFPDLEYTFKHALTHEVAYGSVLHDRRKALHARIVSEIEDLYPDRLVEHVERLGAHAVRGELWDKAVGYLRQAGSKAFARSANREAATWFDRALQASEQLPQTHDTVEQGVDIRFDLRNSLYPLAEFGRLLALLREAETLSETLGDQARLARVSSYLTHYHWVAGQHDRAVEIGERSLSATSKSGSATAAEVMAGNWALGQAYHALGEYQSSVDFFQRMLAAVEGNLVGSRFGSHGLPAIFARSWLARALSELGQFDRAITYAEEGVRLADALGHPFSLTVACWGIGYLHLRNGRPRDAVSVLERAVELCQAWNFLVGYPTSAALLGYSYALSGRVGEAIPLLSEAVEQSRAMGVLFSQSLEAAWLSEAHLLANRIDDALKGAEYALKVAIEQKERGYQAWIIHLHGEIAASMNHGANAKAQTYYAEAVTLATALGMRPLVARCRLSLGRLHQQIAQPTEARAHLMSAATMFREMDMQTFLGQTKDSLKALEE